VTRPEDLFSYRSKSTGGDGRGTKSQKFVLKEGRKIGKDYWLIEMSTDGPGLHVTAYNGDTQETLELQIDETQHKQLLEVNGGYGQLADRLSVEGGSLVITAPASAPARPEATPTLGSPRPDEGEGEAPAPAVDEHEEQPADVADVVDTDEAAGGAGGDAGDGVGEEGQADETVAEEEQEEGA